VVAWRWLVRTRFGITDTVFKLGRYQAALLFVIGIAVGYALSFAHFASAVDHEAVLAKCKLQYPYNQSRVQLCMRVAGYLFSSNAEDCHGAPIVLWSSRQTNIADVQEAKRRAIKEYMQSHPKASRSQAETETYFTTPLPQPKFEAYVAGCYLK
jgi:hypothetical protein